MKDKSTECEARKFITKAHKKGNSGVQKVVDYTRQQLGCRLHCMTVTHNKTKVYLIPDPEHHSAYSKQSTNDPVFYLQVQYAVDRIKS